MSETVDRRALLEQALSAVEDMQARLDRSEADRRAPIAIVGIGCRYPGVVVDSDSYWRLLRDGVDATSVVPADRWDADAYYDADKDAPGKMITRRGGFLDRVDLFDPAFFGISPREAATLDPQQRLLLEVSWEALEDAGTAADCLKASLTGVFVGITTNDYGKVIGLGDTATDVYAATGNALNAAAGRLSFTLGLHGPCVALDTACSSSLVAVHLACQSLRNGECDTALAGGVNVVLLPEAAILFSKWGMLAPDGRCKTFDAAADGFVRSEGCGVLVLKRLADAQRDRDRIVALIRGSAVNQDGASSGLTVPNGPAQQAVVRSALERAGLAPGDIDYVEAHGTGTPLGDPIEAEALAAVFEEGRPKDRPLLIGSVKTNIGHAEAASGVAGLIKVALALQHDEIPPHLHFVNPNPRIPWSDFRLRVPTARTPWPRGERARAAGISSFGFSGTNAHVVLGEAPLAPEHATDGPDRSMHVLAVQARSEKALRACALRLADRVGEAAEADLADIAFSLNTGRAAMPVRGVVLANTKASARDGLQALAEGRDVESVRRGAARGEAPRLAFLFTGQGSQYVGMGRELYDTQPTFKRAFDLCDGIVEGDAGWSLRDVVFGSDASRIDRTEFTQPAIFALEAALLEMWRAWGVTPSAVLGHSVGEYVAAVASGALDLEGALRLVLARGRLMGALPAGGGMLAVNAGEDVVAPRLRGRSRLSVAAVNGPEAIVVSGELIELGDFAKDLAAAGVKAHGLAVSHAFHSPLMEPILAELRTVALGVAHAPPAIDYVSNVTGRLLDSVDASYWVRHTREAVRFSAGIDALRQLGYDTFLELGPQSVLTGMAQRFVTEPSVAWLTSLRKGRSDWASVAEATARAFARGIPVDWRGFDGDYARRKMPLPTYAFQRERHWAEKPKGGPSVRRAGQHPFVHEKRRQSHLEDAYVFDGEIGIGLSPYLKDHIVEQGVVVPATAYTEMALAACASAWGPSALRLHEMEFRKPLFLSEDAVHAVQVHVARGQGHTIEFRVASRPAAAGEETPWTTHAVGLATAVAPSEAGSPAPSLDAIRSSCPDEVTGRAFYEHLHARGNQWGPSFQGLKRLWRGAGEAWAEVAVPTALEAQVDRYQVHPAVADACGHVLTATQSLEADGGPRGGAFVGGGIEEVLVYRPFRGRRFLAHARVRSDEKAAPNVLVGDVRVFDETGALVSDLKGARLWYLSGASRGEGAVVADWLYDVQWAETPVSAASAARGLVLVSEDRALQSSVAAAAKERGMSCVTASSAREGIAALPDAMSDGCDAVVIVKAPMDGSAAALRRATGLAETTGCGGAVAVAQELSRLALQGRAPRLWLVTAGAQPVDGSAVLDPAAAALWGLGRSLALEAAEVWGGLLDLSPDAEPASVARDLLDALALGGREDQVAFRAGRRWTPRLARLRPDKRSATSLRAGASYLITGGMGGLGLVVARWLVERGARRVVLIGRTTMPPRSEWPSLVDAKKKAIASAIQAMEALGASVHLASVDIGDEAGFSTWLAQWRLEGWPPIRGVVHAAGVLRHQRLSEQDASSLDDALGAKVAGASIIDRAFGDSLDFLVLFSSASAVLSSPLLAGYAAGNAFLDGFAAWRARRGRRTLSVNWGMWGEVGMVTAFDAAGVDALALKGMGSIDPGRGLEALEILLGSGATNAAVLPVDWELWRQRYAAFAAAPFLADVMAAQTEASIAAPSVRDSVAAASEAERPALIAEVVRQQVGAVMQLDLATLDLDQPIKDFGLDSLMAVEIRNRIESSIGVGLPLVSILEGPSVAELSTLVLSRFAMAPAANVARAGREPAEDVEKQRAAELLARVDDMSEEEVERLLREMAADGSTE